MITMNFSPLPQINTMARVAEATSEQMDRLLRDVLIDVEDKYSRAVAYLTEHPAAIGPAWRNPWEHRAGCLFVYATRTGTSASCYGGGCLTMVKSGSKRAQTRELTAAICADERMPTDWQDITPDHLPIFAGWQRRLDKVLNRKAASR